MKVYKRNHKKYGYTLPARCTISLKTKWWYFLRRRSRLALTFGREALSTDPGLRETA